MEKLDIFNMALGQCGISSFVQAVDERSHEANVCRQFFDVALDSVLRNVSPSCSRRVQTLAMLGSGSDGFTYKMRYPGNCLLVEKVTSGSVPIDYIVVDNDADKGVAILTNYSDATMTYISRIEIVNYLPPDTALAVAYMLATLICTPLSANAGIAKNLGDAYTQAEIKAIKNDRSENKPVKRTRSIYVEARD